MSGISMPAIRTGRGEGRDYQLKSWFKHEGEKDSRGKKIVAQIFFKTGEASLDANDLHTLNRLVHYYQQRLAEGFHISLSVVGRADVRGGRTLNQALSESRAKEVSYFIKSKLGPHDALVLSHEDYRGRSWSTGRKHSSLLVWADDRRVDIYEWMTSPQLDKQLRRIEKKIDEIDAKLGKLKNQLVDRQKEIVKKDSAGTGKEDGTLGYKTFLYTEIKRLKKEISRLERERKLLSDEHKMLREKKEQICGS
jgi:hypothetical protein